MKHSPAERLKKTKGNKKNRRYNKYVKKTSEKGKVMASRCESVVDLSTLFLRPALLLLFSFSFLFWETAERSCIGPLIARSSNTFLAILFPTKKRFVDERISKFPRTSKNGTKQRKFQLCRHNNSNQSNLNLFFMGGVLCCVASRVYTKN
jgi:hypothetical protein